MLSPTSTATDISRTDPARQIRIRRLLPQFGDVIQSRHGVRLGQGQGQPGIFQRMRQLHLRRELLIGDGVQFDFDIGRRQRPPSRALHSWSG